ncbi:hypothetical protein [Streptomyces sp. NPDC046197]|uniref:hypothetical protein n=1 Tax=Streptomyces sp. NPDC046197 TaxID=3154337 RepID=UPI0033F8361C
MLGKERFDPEFAKPVEDRSNESRRSPGAPREAVDEGGGEQPDQRGWCCASAGPPRSVPY